MAILDAIIVGDMVFNWLGIRGIKYIEKTKAIQSDLTNDVIEKINKEGIYHLTTKENAEKIMESGFIAPTTKKVDNHFMKSRYENKYAQLVYMFAGKPDMYALRKNMTRAFGDKEDGTFYAIKHTPDKYEMENYTKRLEDGAILYEGKLDLQNSNPQLVRMKLEKGKLVEIPLDEKVVPEPFVKKKILTKLASWGTIYKEAGIAIKNSFTPKYRKEMRQLRQQRKLDNKLLRQLNLEKAEKNLELDYEDKSYTLTTGKDRIVDGKILSEFILTNPKNDERRTIYTDRFDISSTSEEKLKSFFYQTIDTNSKLDQYVGRPKFKDGNVIQSIDKEFEEHFSKKQEARSKTDPIYKAMTEKGKKQLNFFERIYKSVPAPFRKNAQDYIAFVKGKKMEKKQEKNIDTKEVLGEER